MSVPFLNRIAKIQAGLTPYQVVIISKPADIQYFSGFETLVPEEREAFLVLSAQVATLFHAPFSPVVQQAGIEYQATTSLEAIVQTIGDWKTKQQLSTNPTTQAVEVQLDFSSMYVSEYKTLEGVSALKIVPFTQANIWQLRMVKDTTEQQAIQKAAQLSAHAYAHAASLLTVNCTELEIAWQIESYIKQRGGTVAFPTIVAFGNHTALPHHQPTARPLSAETTVLIDLGAKVAGYCSDMTRTTWFGTSPSPQFTKIETAVQSAYQAALAVCRQFVTDHPMTPAYINEVDQAARKSLDTAGFGKYYIHTTGHGLGLEIHEKPSIYKTTALPLQVGMVITIEPGVYLPGQLGYRYENTIVLKENTVLELTRPVTL